MSLAQLSRLLPLPESDLQQLLTYAASLSKEEAAHHFNGILGESSKSIDFIQSFNSRRQEPISHATPPQEASVSTFAVPKSVRATRKKKAPLHAPAPRAVHDTDSAAHGTAYVKRDELDYISKKPASTFALQSQPNVIQAAVQAPGPRAPPFAAGRLISDLRPKAISKSLPSSRTSSPGPKSQAKINITGGTSMHGASSTLSELDSAIRSLEISTNPKLQDVNKRRCNCIATRHPLLTAAPNCINCGKVICVKEGLGPCTVCGAALLSSEEIQGMIRELKEERGREKMAIDKQAHRRVEVSKVPAPFSNPRAGPTPSEHGMSAAEIIAKEHRDRLLGFQAQNAQRTTVKDEAADFETPDAGTSGWASPAERARQLKKQQKVLREQEWNARPEYEKRRQVVSIDLVGRRVVKTMGAVERPTEQEDDVDEVQDEVLGETSGNSGGDGKGTFSRNPLLGGLLKPVYNSGKGKEADTTEERKKTWRRVQDDYDDNEEVILDGGAYGATIQNVSLGDEERASG